MLIYEKIKNGRKQTHKTSKGNMSNYCDIFVARENELHLLNKYLQDTTEGNGHFLLITGEAGIGKSALIDHFLENRSEKNAKCYTIRFDRSSAYEPYKPFMALINEFSFLKNQVRQNSSQTDNSAARAKSTGNSQDLFQLQNGQSLVQQRILYNIFQALEDHTIVVSMQDVHLASRTAWQFIHLLANKMIDQKLLLIATLRQEGNALDHKEVPPYHDILRRMTREGLVAKVVLRRFAEKDVTQYLRTVFPKSDFHTDFISWVFDLCNGLPSILCQLIEYLRNRKIIYEQNGIWFNQDKIDKEKFLKSVSHQLNLPNQGINFNNIFAEYFDLLSYAALLSENFDHHLLARLCNRPELDVLKDMIRLCDYKILRQPAENNFQFKYETHKVEVRHKLNRTETRRRYQSICHTLMNDKAYHGRESVFILAEYLNMAGQYDQAFEYLIKSAHLAIENFAVFEGRDLYIRAVKMLKMIKNKIQSERLAQIYLKIANIDRILGNWKESVSYSRKGIKLLKNLKNGHLTEHAYVTLGLLYFRDRMWKKAERQFNKVLTHNNISPFNKMMSYYGLGSTNFELGDYQKSMDQYKIALKLSEQLNLTLMKAKLLSSLGAIESVSGNYFQAISYYSTAIPYLEKNGDYYGLAQIYNNLGLTYAETENWEKADASFSKSLSYSDLVGILPLKSYTFLNRAYTLARMHDLERAREYNEKALRLVSRLNDPLGIAEYNRVTGVIFRQIQNWSESKRYLETAFKDFEKYENELGKAETLYELALLAAARHDNSQMHQKFKEVIKYYEDKGLSAKVRSIEKKYKNVIEMQSPNDSITGNLVPEDSAVYLHENP